MKKIILTVLSGLALFFSAEGLAAEAEAGGTPPAAAAPSGQPAGQGVAGVAGIPEDALEAQIKAQPAQAAATRAVDAEQ